jgi:nitroimidazol reductase NimA-like FMN-containing flavoprotein (pyridoxamine 5'-phosphate oxidase superfamily)
LSKKDLNRTECLRLIKDIAVGRLATCKTDIPHVIPVHYLLHDEKIYIHSRQQGRKIENINYNPNVCFEVSEMGSIIPNRSPCQFSTSYWSVLIYGKAYVIEDYKHKVIILDKLVEKYAGDFHHGPLTKRLIENVAILGIEITSISGRSNLPE